MPRFFKKPYVWAVTYSLILAVFTTLVLLDTFVIPHAGGEAIYIPPAETGTEAEQDSADPEETVITDASYKDGNIKISIETVRLYGTDIYIADITVSDIKYLKTAFAEGTYGRNYKETTSAMAGDSGAILAINGDYYGFRDSGYVLRNGKLYREKAKGGDALVIDADGDFSITEESGTGARALSEAGAWQIFSFGPALIDGGEIAVTASSGVAKELSSNPRTAIGQISALHYIFVVSDGRTDRSAGLSLLELAKVMYDRGCTVAYNLDGGGSSTMWFNGKVVNIPTDGQKFTERSVSDIVYIGY